VYSTLLVPLDGSDLAERALPHAKLLAKQFGGRIHLLRVITPSAALTEIEPVAVDIERAQITEAEEYLERVSSALAGESFDVEANIAVGTPADTIIQYAVEHHIRLIVMYTHGRSGLSRWVYGSVADRVLQGARCPVLLVRDSETDAAQ
jgi:nucleotide-binding universal stress UspA family protein